MVDKRSEEEPVYGSPIFVYIVLIGKCGDSETEDQLTDDVVYIVCSLL
jgi:hypothetical protein